MLSGARRDASQLLKIGRNGVFAGMLRQQLLLEAQLLLQLLECLMGHTQTMNLQCWVVSLLHDEGRWPTRRTLYIPFLELELNVTNGSRAPTGSWNGAIPSIDVHVVLGHGQECRASKPILY